MQSTPGAVGAEVQLMQTGRLVEWLGLDLCLRARHPARKVIRLQVPPVHKGQRCKMLQSRTATTHDLRCNQILPTHPQRVLSQQVLAVSCRRWTYLQRQCIEDGHNTVCFLIACHHYLQVQSLQSST